MLAYELNKELVYRGRQPGRPAPDHKSLAVACRAWEHILKPKAQKALPAAKATDIRLTLPKDERKADPVETYRRLYIASVTQPVWTRRGSPDWWPEPELFSSDTFFT